LHKSDVVLVASVCCDARNERPRRAPTPNKSLRLSTDWLSVQPSNQPPLDLIDHEFDHADDTAANHRGVRVSTVKARWAARPRPGLPDAQEWSTTLALAVIQALVGRRPVAQAAQRSALNAQAVRREERADRERRLKVWQSLY
jgi:hypothetical protein